jgi:EmrB/QacA subfamily drug resistance transporter
MQVIRLSRPGGDARRAGGTGAGRSRATSVALAALCTILFLTFLDNTIVSVGLGSLQTDLHASVADLQWVVGAYALTFASIMLACGMIGDELGRKKVMLSGAGVFCAGSVLCALAPNAQTLIAGRAVMGLGAAASEPGTLSVLRHIYDDARARARAIGVWAAVSGLALALGPVIGGALIGVWSWRGIFWFNLAFGLSALLVAAVVVPESADPRAGRVDTAGTLLGAGALATLIFGIIDAETSGFGATVPVTLFCAAAVLAVGFVWREHRAANPLVDPRFFRLPRFAVPNVVAFCTYFSTFAIFFFTALYFVEVFSDSGFKIALIFAPMTVLMIAASVFAGYWTARTGPRWPITVGCVLFSAGLLLTDPLINEHPDYPLLGLTLAVAGIGIGITVVPVTGTVLDAVPPERSGMAASAANTSREIGAVTGVAVLGALVFSQVNASLTSHLEQLNVSASMKATLLEYKSLIIQFIETGQVSGITASNYTHSNNPVYAEIIGAAYGAFGDAVHAALFVSGALMLLAGLLAAVTLRGTSVRS